MSLRPMRGQPNPGRAGDGRRHRYSESPIPRVATRRVKVGAPVACVAIRPDAVDTFPDTYPITITGGAGDGTLSDDSDSTYVKVMYLWANREDPAHLFWDASAVVASFPAITAPAGYVVASATVALRVKSETAGMPAAPWDDWAYMEWGWTLGRNLLTTFDATYADHNYLTGLTGSWADHSVDITTAADFTALPTVADLEAGTVGLYLYPHEGRDFYFFAAEVTLTVCWAPE